MIKPRLSPVMALGLVAVLTLAGCAEAPGGASPTLSPAATSSSTSTSTSTPTPTPRLSTITLNADSLIAADQDGQQLATFDYYSRGSEVAAKLSELFGFAPVVTVIEPLASDWAFSGTKYDWEGFGLEWSGGYESDPASGTGSYPYSPSVLITVTVPSVRGVIIQGPDGVQVGDGQGDLSVRYPGQIDSYTDQQGAVTETVRVHCVDLSEIVGPYESDIPRNCVAVRAAPSAGPITGLQVPAKMNYGI